jgi:hypothetical protein
MTKTILENICTGIVTVGARATAIKTYSDPPPAKLDSGDLPALCVFTGQASEDEEIEGDHLVERTRMMRVQVPVIATGQANAEEREARCRPLMDAVSAAFRAAPSLGGTAFVQRTRVLGDSGIVILPEWGGKFVGFEVRLQVISLEPRVYAKGE